MKFNHHFYQTNSFLFGLTLVLAPLVGLLTSRDPIGRLLNIGCQLFGVIFLIESLIQRRS